MLLVGLGAGAVWAYYNLELCGDAWIVLLVGGILIVGGLVFAGFSRRRVLDKTRGQVEIGFGVFVPFRLTRHPLTQFQNVALRHEIRTRSSRHGQQTYHVYPLELEGSETVKLEEGRKVTESRQNAEAVAKYLDLPLHDSSSDTTVVREARDLDKTLAERRRVAGERIELPKQPPDSEITVFSQGGETRLVLPRQGLKTNHVLPMLGGPASLPSPGSIRVFTKMASTSIPRSRYSW